ncbi:hypothetical protein OESDEN_05491 [Oesophagostomum dentatum]|uniref:Uncharacterized protein n=2 Tax=Oesophagostomum dentatum TaxID=61180 RepID=A0A0B1TEP6_OESDE|nr:hypothetical protein OESDEN_05491 [Oesophagostomum dentatum]
MKEAEVAGERSQPAHGGGSRNSLEQTPKPSEIDIDEVFCAKKGKSSSKECTCNACNLTKLTDEERARLTRNSIKPKVVRHVEEAAPRRPSSSNSTPAVDISLDDVFSPIRSSPIHVIKRYGDEPQDKERSGSIGEKKENGEERSPRSPHSVHFELQHQNTAEIDLDEVFPLKKTSRNLPKRKLGRWRVPRSRHELPLPRRKSELLQSLSQQKKESLDWVAALVSTDSKDQKKNSVKEVKEIKETPKTEPAKTEETLKANGNRPHANSTPPAPTSVPEPAPAKRNSASEHKGFKEWLHSLVKSDPHKEHKPKHKTTAEANKQLAEIKKNVGSAPNLSDDLIHKVFDREGSSRSDSKRCGCAACADGSPTPVPKERKRRSTKKEEVFI